MIQDIEKLQFFDRNYYFTLYPKIWIFRGFTSFDGPRFKVGVLGERYVWTPKTPSFAWEVCEVESFEFGKCSRNFLGSWLTLQEVGKLPTLVYSSSRSHLWPWLSRRGCLVVSQMQNNAFFWVSGMNRLIGWSTGRSFNWMQ